MAFKNNHFKLLTLYYDLYDSVPFFLGSSIIYKL